MADYVVHSVAMTTLTLGAVESHRRLEERRSARQEHVRTGLVVVDVRATDQRPARPSSGRSSPGSPTSPRPTSSPSRRAGTTAKPPKLSAPPMRSPGRRCRPGNIGRSRATPRCPTASSRPVSWPGIQVMLGSYPITPASDILHELSKHKNFNVITFQAEDEISGICAALGAAYGGALGVTSTSGPGISLKSEAIGLGVMTELPLLVIDVQRGGPRPACPPRPSKLTCCRHCMAAMGSHRWRCWRPGHRPTALTSRSRRCASRCRITPR